MVKKWYWQFYIFNHRSPLQSCYKLSSFLHKYTHTEPPNALLMAVTLLAWAIIIKKTLLLHIRESRTRKINAYSLSNHWQCFNSRQTCDLILQSIKKYGQTCGQFWPKSISHIAYNLSPVKQSAIYTSLFTRLIAMIAQATLQSCWHSGATSWPLRCKDNVQTAR